MIVVTGASGKLGRQVLAELLRRTTGDKLVAVARDPSKLADLAARGVEIRRGDYAEPASLTAALAGASRVLLISGTDMQHRLRHHTAVVEAAVAARVELLAYTSVLRADTTELPVAPDHKATELVIRQSGLPFVVLRNGWYIENYLGDLARTLALGAYLGAAGDGRISGASRADYAAAAAAVLTQPDHRDQVYELAGDTSFTMAALAAAVARWSGKHVGYHDLPVAELVATLVRGGLPPFVAELFGGVDAAIARGALLSDRRELRALIGRATQTVDQVLAALPRPSIT